MDGLSSGDVVRRPIPLHKGAWEYRSATVASLLFFTGGCARTQLILHSSCLAFLLKVSEYSLIAIYARFPVSHNVLNCE